MLFREEAVVLRTWKLGEADLIVNLLTHGKGKIRAVAKGARKPQGRMAGRVDPGAHIAVQLYEGRELHTLTQVDLIETFASTRLDLDRVGDLYVMLEAVDRLAVDHAPEPRIYSMLVGALRSLEEKRSVHLVAAFLLRLLDQDGALPALHLCTSCGEEDTLGHPLVALDVTFGGMVCSNCRRETSVGVRHDALDVIYKISKGSVREALALPTSSAAQVRFAAESLFEAHVERRLRSSGVFEH